jgi:hypothetical protein
MRRMLPDLEHVRQLSTIANSVFLVSFVIVLAWLAQGMSKSALAICQLRGLPKPPGLQR